MNMTKMMRTNYGSADDSDNAMKRMTMDGAAFLFSPPITQKQKVVNGLNIANYPAPPSKPGCSSPPSAWSCFCGALAWTA